MSVNYTQYVGGTKVTVETPSGAVPGSIITRVYDLTDAAGVGNIDSFKAVAPNYIAKVKCVGTENEAIKIDITHMDGSQVGGIQLEESDEMNGPFRKIALSASQPAGTTTSIAIVWEAIVG